MCFEVKDVKKSINAGEGILEILKYSHFNPTRKKLEGLVKKYHENKDIFPFASLDKGKTLGVIVIKKINHGFYEIIDISVAPGFRTQGIASKLIDYVIEKFNIKNLFAETDNDAVGFYKKYGFKTEFIKDKEYTRYKCVLLV